MMEGQARILIVDDEPFNLDYLEQELEDLNYETRTASNGREALDQVALETPDVILLDIMMPEMNGFQVLAHLKSDETVRHIPVIVVSALDDVDSVVRGIEMGAEDYLSKPFNPVLLRARISACLEKKRMRDREVAHMLKTNQDLDLAWQVQAGLLPEELPDIRGWQLAAMLKPSRQTSGDFYDIIPLPDGRWGILIADVADKGIASTLFMVLSRTLIRTFATQYGDQPDSVLKATNQRILTDIDTSQFVTVFYGILDPAEGTLTYCNAGHNPPYLFRAPDGSEMQALFRTGMPLGILRRADWECKSTRLAAGDTLVLYTDGLTDAQDAQQRFYGERRLLEAAQTSLGHSAQEVLDALLASVRAFVRDASQFDDIALAVLVRDPQ
jgi:serine phosphatase RsbU (regulator of sigma subunit)